MKLPITAFTVSLEVSDNSYGNGQKNFVNLRAESPDPAQGLSIEEAINQSLDMHLKAWESILQVRYAERRMNSEEFKSGVTHARTRLSKTRAFLSTLNSKPEPTE